MALSFVAGWFAGRVYRAVVECGRDLGEGDETGRD